MPGLSTMRATGLRMHASQPATDMPINFSHSQTRCLSGGLIVDLFLSRSFACRNGRSARVSASTRMPSIQTPIVTRRPQSQGAYHYEGCSPLLRVTISECEKVTLSRYLITLMALALSNGSIALGMDGGLEQKCFLRPKDTELRLLPHTRTGSHSHEHLGACDDPVCPKTRAH